MKKRRDKVEEIKKKTNYYSTRDLIQKYDESSPAGTPLRQRFPPAQVPQTPQGRPIPNGTNPMTTGPRSGLQAAHPRTRHSLHRNIHVIHIPFCSHHTLSTSPSPT